MPNIRCLHSGRAQRFRPMLEALCCWSSRRKTSRHGRSVAKQTRSIGATMTWSSAAPQTHLKRPRRRRARFQRYWRAAIDQIISRRKASPTAPAHRDLLDLLLSVRDAETGEALSDGEIRDQCATMFFAGSETTARLLFWACYLLAMDSEEQSRVREEVTTFRPERIGGPDDLQNWRRLRNVLLEALRLYPPVPLIFRVANGPDEICGEKIGANTQVLISSWVMHRHRRFWDQPTAFLPDRFAGKTAPWTQTPAFIPFGAGPRICIGLWFALLEAEMVMAQLLACYSISLPGARPVLPVGRVTIEPSYEPSFRLESL
jgi:cytochrome P450